VIDDVYLLAFGGRLEIVPTTARTAVPRNDGGADVSRNDLFESVIASLRSNPVAGIDVYF